MLPFPDVDTRDALAVADRIRELLQGVEQHGDMNLVERVFEDVQLMFHGQFGDFRPIDLRYHDYQHTLQASLCMAELLAGRDRARATPHLTWRQIELGMVAVLMHDTGYLTTAADGEGTGAKFTYTHVLRSAAVAASQLPRYGVHRDEIEIVLNAIRCTGPTANIEELHYSVETDRLLGCCVSTADFLGQLAASDYPDELDMLYREFKESDDYLRVPLDQRMFASTRDLIRKTPSFWDQVVKPKLDRDYQGVYRYLADPFPDGPNPYLIAIERNMETVRRRIEELAP